MVIGWILHKHKKSLGNIFSSFFYNIHKDNKTFFSEFINYNISVIYASQFLYFRMMNQQYSNLISKIEVFIRKYYKNQLIKGVILSISLIISFFLLAISLEHIIHFGTTLRRIIFYLYLFTASIIFIHYIFRPIAGLIRIGKDFLKKRLLKLLVLILTILTINY